MVELEETVKDNFVKQAVIQLDFDEQVEYHYICKECEKIYETTREAALHYVSEH